MFASTARGEVMLQLFNLTWNQVSQKIPEIAEAGYDSLWLPPPAKAGSVFSVGYDCFDPFDLGNLSQNGTVATKWGTEADLLQMVQMAHRFGLRVYFDNIANHRGFVVPGYNAQTPTNYYPGLLPRDFHLQTGPGGFFTNWASVSDFNNQWDEQFEPLGGLIDLANEPGVINGNFGPTLGNTIPKISFIRQPAHPEYYMDTNGPSLGGPWHPFNGSSGQPVAEDVNAYLIRAAMWTLYTTKCDGFRLDAVKHVPSGFFGDSTPDWNGYLGGIQAMFDWVHGFGTNVTGNGYFEADDMRNSCFDTEAPRNDAMLFGEHLGAPPSFSEYLNTGMRLLNTPLQNQMNGNLGNSSGGLWGMDGRDYTAPARYDSENGVTYPCYSAIQGVQYAESADYGNSYATHKDLQYAYYFTHEGLPEVYSDGYNESPVTPGQKPFPDIAANNFLGEFGDDKLPELCYLHNQMSRGGTRSRWSDNDTVIFERYDYREGSSSDPADQDVMLFAMNDNYGFPGDINFNDPVTSRPGDGYYECYNGSNSRGVGIVIGFPPGTVLVQMAQSSLGVERACAKLLVHGATTNLAQAQATAGNADPVSRLIYVGGQTLAPGGGAVQLMIPSGGYLLYGIQWPEASRAAQKDAISLQQGGEEVPRITVLRQDGTNGDTGFSPQYPFKMRGSVDQFGNVIAGVNYGNLTYAIDIPVVTNAAFDILVRNDASSGNALVKLDGGTDINSQMGLGATNGVDLRDNRPGYATDVFLGYEQAAFQFQNGPEKFGSENILSNNIVSTGAETFVYMVGQSNSSVVFGAGYGEDITNATAQWVFHNPTNTSVTVQGTNVPPAQLNPPNPGAGEAADVWVKVGYQFQINTGFIYYTVDGSDPEGAFGVGRGTTKAVPLAWVNHDNVTQNIDWWKGTIPGQSGGAQVRYKVGLFYHNLSAPISNAEPSGSKLYGVTEYAITNFNPATARVWWHNDLNTNNAAIGLQEGFHILRARTFLPCTGKSSVFNTFSQTFYYDAQLPSGVIAFPPANGMNITSGSYTVVVRADTTTTGVDFNIQDGSTNNDDVVTGQANGNGRTNGVPIFVAATPVTPDPTITQEYPNLPQEYRFNYVSIPSSGTATITVRLKKLTTSVYPSRVTILTRTVSTLAPARVLEISSPAADGQTLLLRPSDSYPVQACFSQSLDTNTVGEFSVRINGVLQPRTATNGAPLYTISATGCSSGLRALNYNWTGALPGTNVIQVAFSNSVVLTATRTVTVVDPTVRITSFSVNATGDTLTWNTIPNQIYQVWATTNLTVPLAPLSGLITANGPSTSFIDPSPGSTKKFYQVQLLRGP